MHFLQEKQVCIFFGFLEFIETFLTVGYVLIMVVLLSRNLYIENIKYKAI